MQQMANAKKPKPVISFNDVSKEYRRYTSNHQRLWHEVFWRDTGEVIPALKNVSFNIEKGEKVAIIGGMGSGRTTVMRLMAKMIKTNSGKVFVREKPDVIFNNRIGFSIGLTGRENIKLKGTLMGWSLSKCKEYEDEIIDFADVREIIDKKVKTYSRGTLTRLGFTIATATKPKLLLYDEFFNFGGQYYFVKCIERLKELISGDDTTFVMTAGNFNVARKLCTRGIVLYKGELVFDGPVDEAVKYFRANCKADMKTEREAQEEDEAEEMEMDDESEGNDFG